MAKGPTFHFICGEDSFLVGQTAKKWWQQALEGGPEDPFCHAVLEGDAATVGQAQEALGAFVEALAIVPLWGKRMVWLKDVSFLADSVTGRSKTVQDALEGLKPYLEAINPEHTAVLISAHPVDRRRSFAKWCEKNSHYQRLALEGESELLARLQADCQRLGLQASEAGLHVLVSRVHANPRVLAQELEKLSLYLGTSGVLTPECVLKLVPAFGESDFFEPVEAFYTQGLPQALAALERYFFCHAEPRPLLASFQNRNRLLIQLKALQEAGQLGPRVSKAQLDALAARYASLFPQNASKSSYCLFGQNPFYLGRLMGSLGRFSLPSLTAIQTDLLALFQTICQTPQAAASAFQAFFIRTLGKEA